MSLLCRGGSKLSHQRKEYYKLQLHTREDTKSETENVLCFAKLPLNTLAKCKI